MCASLESRETKHTLVHAQNVQERDTLTQDEWNIAPNSAFNIFVLFNLEAAADEGHCILALGSVGGTFETYSYYRQGTKISAPGIMACLKEPMSFQQLRDSSGWIIHGQPGNYWNEHVNAAIALWCDKESYEKVRAYAQAKTINPGTYNLITYNCLTFVDDALKQANIHFTTKKGKQIRTFIPKDAFFKIDGVEGAHKFEAWKYWFNTAKAPINGLRTISDMPGHDKPLK